MIVVIIGVTVLLLTAQLLIEQTVPREVQTHLALLLPTQPTRLNQATMDLLATFQQAVLSSLVLAALASLMAGLLTSLFLTRQILRSLRHLTQSSQRIANGHYNERVVIPDTDELALVATNFNQMAASLEQVEQQRVALIGNVSHELRTPLTGIEGYLEGLMDGLFPKDEETFAQMYQEVRRLKRLVGDLQTLSSIEAGQFSLHTERFDLLPVVRRVVTQLKPQILAQCLEIVTECPEFEVWVLADPDRTAQILMNLIGNAIHYTPENGCITVRIRLNWRMAEIAVQDTGIGIPAEALPYLFERFYRVDRSRARSSGGSGIGLTISRHLAWAMGGELTVTSDGPGQGSTFFLTVPLANP